jgi:hypothetical protein
MPDIETFTGRRVNPGHVHARQGNTITWQNKLGEEVVIEILDTRLFGKAISHSIASGGAFTSPQVAADCEDGEYEYCVYCPIERQYAIGHSSPKIIVP